MRRPRRRIQHLRQVSTFALCALLISTTASPATAAAPRTAAPHAQQSHSAEEFGTDVSSGYVPVRDGTRLHATLVRPLSDGPFPTLMVYQGYSSNTVFVEQYLLDLVRRDRFALLVVTVRGTGCSEGEWDLLSPQEARDGYDVVEWTAAQPWSDGRVALVGGSYAGFMQLPVAALRPPHLVAIAPSAPFGDIYRDVAYPGGIPNAAVPLGLTALAVGSSSGTVVLATANGDRDCLQRLSTRPAAARLLPPLQQLQHAWDDELMRERSPITGVPRIQVPAHIILGWQDGVLGSRGADILSHLSSRYHAVLTNGGHATYSSPALVEDLRAFLRHYVKGEENGYRATPPVRVWWERRVDERSGTGSWVTAHRSWPPSNTTVHRSYLSTSGRLQSTPGSGGGSSYVYVPGTGQSHQRVGRSDANSWQVAPAPGAALAWTGEPLTADLVTVGAASVDLALSSTALDADVQVTLVEVLPTGEEVYVQSGWLRASHRKLDEERSTATAPYHTHLQHDSAPLQPQAPTLMRIEVPPFGHVFRAGSRLRLWVESPKVVPDDTAFAAFPLPGVNTVHHDGALQSSVALSTLPGERARAPRPGCGVLRDQPCRRP